MRVLHYPWGEVNWGNVIGLIGVAGFILAVVGELLGWWKEFGELLALVSLSLALLGPFLGAGRRQLGNVGDAVGHQIRDLGDDLGGQLRAIDRKLDKLDKLDAMDRKLDNVATRDAQDEQTALLRDIRDLIRERGAQALFARPSQRH